MGSAVPRVLAISARSRLSSVELSLAEVAAELGVHYMTVYKYVRTGRLPARQVGREWRVRRSDLAAFVAPGTPRVGAGRSQMAARLRDRMVAGDEAGAWAVIEGALASGADAVTVLVDGVGAAMRRVGDDWARGDIDVADEHRASAVGHRLLGRLSARSARRGRRRSSVVIAAPSGDHHALAVALAADVLRIVGYDVIEGGADLPPHSFVAAVQHAERAAPVRALVITVTTTGLDEVVRSTVAEVRAAIANITIVVGGPAVRDLDHARALGADHSVSGSAVDLMALLDGLS